VLVETPTQVVNTTSDSVVANDGLTSLREAIIYANSRPGTVISFNIPSTAGPGVDFNNVVWTIKPTSALPA
jgi:CSLREA domain-containing protein